MNSKFKKFKAISTGSWVPENLSKSLDKSGETYNIIIKDLKLNALIGIHPHEKNKKQKISINILIQAKDNFSNTNDDIKNVVSYENIVNDIKVLAKKGHTGLLEVLADKISLICFKDSRVINSRIKIEKLEVFKETHSVGIEIFREKENKVNSRKNQKIIKIKK